MAIAKDFFSVEHRENICSAILKQEDRENFAILLSYFNKIITVSQQCDRMVIPERVKELGLALMLHHKQTFPFAVISPSVHQMCVYNWELFEIINGSPIAMYAEQSREAWNKHIRSYKSGTGARARQCSIRINTRDIVTRMLLHPYHSVFQGHSPP